MKKGLSIKNLFLPLLLISLALIGCGGGGGSGSDGGGGGGLTYSGKTTPASINSTNAETITSEALLAASVGAAFTLSSSSPEDVNPATNRLLVIELPKLLHRSARSADWPRAGEIALQRTESETIAGSCGGTLSYTLTVNDSSGDFVGIFVYSGYCDDGITINGRVNVDGSIDLATGEFNVINFAFENLATDDVAISGDLSINEAGPSTIVSMDFLVADTTSDKIYWINDYTLVITEIDVDDTEVVITGTFYYPDYGYVTVSTPLPFIFISTDEWPSSGMMLCEGSGNTSAKLTAVDNQFYEIAADTNGDAIDDYFSGVQRWADL